jgi:hypothetical protein
VSVVLDVLLGIADYLAIWSIPSAKDQQHTRLGLSDPTSTQPAKPPSQPSISR